MDKINEIWPKWHTVEPIGKGTFGEVYKVKREEFGETFYSAVKVIGIPNDKQEIQELMNEGQTSSFIRYYYESIAKNLMNEIKVLEKLKSAGNVVNIEEFEIQERKEEVGWDVYIRMELLKNLNEYRQGRQMEWEEVEKLGLDLCRALEYCEQCKIIHRDIKPSNIFVDDYGNFKLGDFGIARQMERTQSMMSQKGTEKYMAPEVRFGNQKGSYNVDIYSLGLVMYQLLNRNRMPFESLNSEFLTFEDRERALWRRLEGEEISPPIDASEGLGKIIVKACTADKNVRYQSAHEMYADLTEWRKEKSNGTEKIEEAVQKKIVIGKRDNDKKIEPISEEEKKESTILIDEERTIDVFQQERKAESKTEDTVVLDRNKEGVWQEINQNHIDGKFQEKERNINKKEKKKIKRGNAVANEEMVLLGWWAVLDVANIFISKIYLPKNSDMILALASIVSLGIMVAGIILLLHEDLKKGVFICTVGGSISSAGFFVSCFLKWLFDSNTLDLSVIIIVVSITGIVAAIGGGTNCNIYARKFIEKYLNEK